MHMNTDAQPSLTPADPDARMNEQALLTIEALEQVLAELSEDEDRADLVPQWEFCEGFMTAMLCMRRTVDPQIWVYALLGPVGGAEFVGSFQAPEQETRFMMHWHEREAQIRQMLEAYLEDPSTELPLLEPTLMDWKGLSLALQGGQLKLDEEDPTSESLAEKLGVSDQFLSYGQTWAKGFSMAVFLWPDDWKPPRDQTLAANWEDALDCILTLTRPDEDAPSLNMVHEQASPSVSETRFNDVGEALFAVHDLYAMAKMQGPLIEPVRRGVKIGRNDPCPCGSGKKYKHCCAA